MVAASLAAAASAETLPPCSLPGSGWCLARRINGTVPQGEVGFRFGEPLDVDGDGRADVAAGTRFKSQGIHQNGMAEVWSGASGARLRAWDGEATSGLFGHWVMPVPDLGDDGLADVIISAPNAAIDGTIHGLLVARSPKTGDELWRRSGSRNENLGWDLALAGDQDGDGRVDLFAGAPAKEGGRVVLLSGRDGGLLRTYAPRRAESTFGWFVARLDDLDRDGHADLAVGSPSEVDPGGASVGAAYVFSARSGEMLRQWRGDNDHDGFGEVVAGLGDLDGDGRGEIAVAAPRTSDLAHDRPGDLFVYSGATGRELRHWSGRQPGELFARMVVAAGDLDGDGVDDLAIGAPWYGIGPSSRVGRVELRSGRSGEVLGELTGETADAWFGWHIRRAPDPDGLGRPTLLVSSLRHPVDGQPGVGVLDLLVLRPQAQAATPSGN